MSPWAVLEWSLAIGLSIGVAFLVIVAIALSTKAIFGKPKAKRVSKPVVKKPAPAPVAAKKTTPTTKK